jgi:hypothetical protein
MTPAQFEQSNITDKQHFITETNTALNENFVDFEDIDTKKVNSFNAQRKLATTNMLRNEYGFKGHFKSAARGDKKMVRVDGKSSVGDDKLYDAITGVMKFPQELGLVSADFTKGIDSNMKYALNNVLDIKFYSDDTKSVYENLRKEVYRKGSNKGLQATDVVVLGTISSENFTHFISYNEIGFAYQELELVQEKFFICANITDRKNIKSSANYKYMKKIDFTTMTQGDVEVSLHVDSKFNYVYLVFRNQGDIVYIVSQRKNLNTANCSFINNKKFTILKNTKKSL